MNKALKIFLILAGTVVGLIIAAMIVLPMIVDPNDYKDDLAQIVHDQTGRTLVMDGDMKLSVFPWLGVEIGPVRLSDDPAFGDRDFVSIQGADVKVALLPLLSSRFDVKNVTLNGLTMVLSKDKKGHGNWESLSGTAAADTPAQSESRGKTAGSGDSGAADAASGGGGLPVISVGSVSVTDANVRYEDLATGDAYTVKGLNLTTGELNLADADAFTDIALGFTAEVAQPRVTALVDLTAKANMNDAEQIFSLRDLLLKVDAQGDPFPTGTAQATVTGKAIDVNMGAQSASVQGLGVQAYKLDLAADATVKGLDAVPSYTGVVTLNPSNLRAAMAALGSPLPPMKDDKALTDVSATVRFEGTTKKAAVPEIKIGLDGASITGTARADDFTGPSVAFKLAADALNADRYMPGASAGADSEAPGGADSGTTGAAKTDSAKKDGDVLIDDATRQTLRSLKLDGVVDVASLTLYNAKLDKVHLTVTANDGVIRVAPLTALLYGGKYTTTALMDVRRKDTAFKLDTGLDKLEIGNLVQDMTANKFLSGLTNLSLNLSGQGATAKTLLKSLSGAGDLSILDGAFHGFQIVPNEARQHLKNESQKKALDTVGKRQEFEAIRATFKIAKGVLSNNDLRLKSANLNAKGGGIVDLARGEMDYLAYVDIPAMPILPIRADGPFSDLSYGLDSAEFAKGIAKTIINKPVDIGGSVLGGVGSALGLTGDDSNNSKEGSGERSGDSGESSGPGAIIDSIGSIFGGKK